jgi:D-3-phosphoglycerate dehydrogenase
LYSFGSIEFYTMNSIYHSVCNNDAIEEAGMTDHHTTRGVLPAVVLLSERLGPITQNERRIEADVQAVVRSAALWTLDDIHANGADADLIIVGAVEPFDAEALDGLPNLRAIVRRGVGVDNVDVAAATARGIVVANVTDASVEEVSDHALTLLLAIERQVAALDAAVRGGPMGLPEVRGGIRRMNELTLGLVGFGRIGQALARKATAIYSRVIAADPFGRAEDAERLGVDLVDLSRLLSDADHISLHVPLGSDTRDLIGPSAFALMRERVVIVNTARGGLVDEAALADAIRQGRVAGAGLDVTAREPIGPDDQLLTVPRLLLTGHSALASVTAQAELGRRSVDAAIDLLHGRRPASVVDLSVLESPRLRIPDLATES